MEPKIKIILGIIAVIMATIINFSFSSTAASFLQGFLFALGFVYIFRGLTKK